MSIRSRHLILPLLLALPLCFTALHAQQTAGLQQHPHDKVVTRVVDSSGKPVFYASDKKRHAFESHIVGHFSGWHGTDQFTLANGQVWQQTGSDQPMCMNADNPTVTVKPSLFGNWLMYVHGCNDNVHVKRIH
jgi:hypothetical protein